MVTKFLFAQLYFLMSLLTQPFASFQDKDADANSSNSSGSHGSTEEDLWTLWGKIINEWDASSKKRLPQIKVMKVSRFLCFVTVLCCCVS